MNFLILPFSSYLYNPLMLFQPVDGVGEIKLNAKRSCSAPQTSASSPAPLVLGSATKVICRCPEVRAFICTITVESNGNAHTVICNNMASTTISCGSELFGRNLGLIPIFNHNHPLCTKKGYLSIKADVEWSCKDPSVPVPSSNSCSQAPTTSKCKCGVKRSIKIVGGQEADVSFVFTIISFDFNFPAWGMALDRCRESKECNYWPMDHGEPNATNNSRCCLCSFREDVVGR